MAHEHPERPPFDLDAAGNIDWDALYSREEKIWSGQPNGSLVSAALGLTPGRALDVGCGEGADVIWLAQQGWDVTGLEVSAVALARAQAHACAAGVTARWLHAGLLEADLPAEFDLVSLHYPGLLRTENANAERALLAAVAPGGLLLAVFHADVDVEHARACGFDPEAYIEIEQLREALAGEWQIIVDDRKPRSVTTGRGAHHIDDLVLIARKPGR